MVAEQAEGPTAIKEEVVVEGRGVDSKLLMRVG